MVRWILHLAKKVPFQRIGRRIGGTCNQREIGEKKILAQNSSPWGHNRSKETHIEGKESTFSHLTSFESKDLIFKLPSHVMNVISSYFRWTLWVLPSSYNGARKASKEPFLALGSERHVLKTCKGTFFSILWAIFLVHYQAINVDIQYIFLWTISSV